MKQSYFIDTSVAIDYINGKNYILNFIDNLHGSLYTNYIVIAELSEGIYRVKDKSRMEEAIDNYIAGMDKSLEIDYRTAKEFGKIRADLRKKGLVIEDIDVLIAANCIANNLTLVTLNEKHFNRVENLEILNPNNLLN